MSALPLPPPLREAYRDRFQLGVAIDLRDLVPGYVDVVARHFSSVTPENALKPAWAQPEEGRFELGPIDDIAGVAEANGQRVYGHTLVWHHQTPRWMFTRPDGSPLTACRADRALMRDRVRTHIETLTGHLGARAWAWEVANEAVDETEPDHLRRTPWRDVLGDDYLCDLFQLAHEAAPHALLVLNDFETERPARRDALLGVVQRLRDAGAPIGAVGHQFHLTVDSSLDDVADSLAAFEELGVDQVVTELDVSISRTPTESLALAPADRIAALAPFYRRLFEVLLDHAESLRAVTIWGVGDGHSWLRYWPTIRLHEAPLLFDDQLRPKPAFWSVLGAAAGDRDR